MTTTENIKKIFTISFWIGGGLGLMVLLIAAVNSRNEQVCRAVDVNINNRIEGKWFVSPADIKKSITGNSGISPVNRPVKSFDLSIIENRLEKEVWVKDAQLYFDNNGVLRVKVTQREPVARIFTPHGDSFFIDSTGKKLPLSDRVILKLPVFTGYPFQSKKPGPKEKKLLKDICSMSSYLTTHPFWMAQVAQTDITATGEFEMIPVLGNHLIEFGGAENMEEKFARLLLFYRQVLSQVGMDKYERIRVQYAGQIVGVKHHTTN